MSITRRARTDSGASAVEFALVAPIFFAVLFAIVSFGWLLANELALSNAARQAARYAVVPGHTCDDIKNEAVAAAGIVDDLTTGHVTVDAGCDSETGEPCRDSAIGTNITVAISYDADVLLPVPGLGSSRTLTSTGVFRCEFS